MHLLLLVLLTQVAHAAGTFSIALPNEPANLDSTRSTELVGNFILGHVMEGLTRYGKKPGEALPGVAKSWTLNGIHVQFKLREDAKWSDGKPVTAKDFLFAWRKVVEPANASPYAFILFPILNAEEIAAGKMPVTELGVKAPDERTLEVTLAKPCPYFLSLTAYTTYFPLREDFYTEQKGKYASSAATILTNGPFTLKAWIQGASLSLERNPAYWRSREIQLDRIEVPSITADAMSRFNLFKDKKLDYVTLPGPNELKLAQVEHYKIQTFSQGELAFLRLNFRPGRPTANLNLRKAIRAAIDTRELAAAVVGIPGTRPGNGMIPDGIPGATKTFRQEHPLKSRGQELQLAKAYLENAKRELGGAIPPLTLLSTETARAQREGEYLQAVLKKTLGIELRIDKQILKQSIAKAFAGEFDLAVSSWVPDYLDPMAYAEIFTSWNKNNRGKYLSDHYDAQIRLAIDAVDARKRSEFLAKAERQAIDDVAFIPTWETVEAYVVGPKVKGLVRHAMGPDPDLSYLSFTRP